MVAIVQSSFFFGGVGWGLFRRPLELGYAFLPHAEDQSHAEEGPEVSIEVCHGIIGDDRPISRLRGRGLELLHWGRGR